MSTTNIVITTKNLKVESKKSHGRLHEARDVAAKRLVELDETKEKRDNILFAWKRGDDSVPASDVPTTADIDRLQSLYDGAEQLVKVATRDLVSVDTTLVDAMLPALAEIQPSSLELFSFRPTDIPTTNRTTRLIQTGASVLTQWGSYKGRVDIEYFRDKWTIPFEYDAFQRVLAKHEIAAQVTSGFTTEIQDGVFLDKAKVQVNSVYPTIPIVAVAVGSPSDVKSYGINLGRDFAQSMQVSVKDQFSMAPLRIDAPATGVSTLDSTSLDNDGNTLLVVKTDVEVLKSQRYNSNEITAGFKRLTAASKGRVTTGLGRAVECEIENVAPFYSGRDRVDASPDGYVFTLKTVFISKTTTA